MGIGGLLGGIVGSVVSGVANAVKNNANKGSSGSKGSSSSGSSGSSGSKGSGGSSGSSAYAGGYYDKTTDYEALINNSVKNGDLSAAAQYEQFRNNKITSEGLDYGTTDRFSSYLPKSQQQATTENVQDSGYVPGQGFESNDRYINEMYEAQKEAQKAELNKQYDSFKAQNQSDTAALPQQYQGVKDQSELERWKANKALKQQMADSGTMYSGQGRQATLEAETTSANRLNDINTAEQDAANNLRLALQQAQIARDSGIASANANADASASQALLNDLYRKQDAAREDYWNSKNFDLSQAGVTGYYNGSKTMQSQYQDYQIEADKRDYELRKRELEDKLATNQITRAQYEEELKALQRENKIGDKYDDQKAAAELATLQASASGRSSGGSGSRTYQSSVNTGSYTRQGSTVTANNNSNANGSGTKTEAAKSWVYVPGYGRQGWGELQVLVDSGKVQETYDPVTGKYSYKKIK